MKNTTSYLPGFHWPIQHRKPRSTHQELTEEVRLLKQKSFTQLGDCLGKYIPRKYLLPAKSGALSRRRIFSKENTFWAFLSQVLSGDRGCKEAVRKLQAYAALKSNHLPSSSTAAYCNARKKLDEDELKAILHYTAKEIQCRSKHKLLKGRRVIVVDGTGVSMPDSVKNQEQWPQYTSQKPGCGFPQAALCACFNLYDGSLLSYQLGNKKSHELPMLRKQWDTFNPNDIFLGDKGFCSYFDISSFKDRGVDSVVTLARRTPVCATEAIKVLGEDDLLITWKKPTWNKAGSYSFEDWKALPETLSLRQIKVNIKQKGFRSSSFYIITSLLDAQEYPAHEIAELYLQRWNVEVFFRDIKTTMGMDILRCKTPAMIRKEILMHLIAYNCIRRLMIEAAETQDLELRKMSFKGSVQALRQWEPHLYSDKMNGKQQAQLIRQLYDSIATNLVVKRPGRREPRAVKRRPKPFQLLNKPRAEMIETQHRGKRPKPA